MVEITRSAAVLARALREAPVEIVSRSKLDPRGEPVSVAGGRTKEPLTLLWAGEGWPADVDEVLADTPDPWPRDLVVIARRFSPGALRSLRERDANWADETGDARIIGPSRLFVIRLKRGGEHTRPSAEGRPFEWTPSAVAVAEAVLTRPTDPILNSALAEMTAFSAPQVSRTLGQFDKRGWTRKTGTERGPGAQRVLEDGNGLLRSWAGHVARESRPAIQAHAIFKAPFKFVRESLAPALDKVGDWALSGWAGLELEAPFATQVPTLHIYVPEANFDSDRLEDVLSRGGLRRVEEGGRVIFWPADTTALRLKKTSERDHLPVVSAPRLYADLLGFGGRGSDAAEHVRELLVDF